MAETRAYYSEKGLSATFYDLTTALDPSLAGDIDLYAGLAPPGGAVLELGAGTGRVAYALAARGFSVLGIELAPNMLAQAEARGRLLAPEIARRVRLRRGDMAALNLSETFDLVICPYFGLAHLPAGAAWRNVFRGVAAHLKPGGLAAVHLPLAERLAAAPPAAPDRPVLQAELEAGRRLKVYVRERAARPALGRFDQVVDYVVEGPGGIEASSRERLTYYAADPTPFAAEAGLQADRDAIPLGGVGAAHVFRRP